MQYIVTGIHNETNKRCLVYVCSCMKEHAEKVLNRIITEPNEQDIKFINTHHDFRVDEIKNEDAWWLNGTD